MVYDAAAARRQFFLVLRGALDAATMAFYFGVGVPSSVLWAGDAAAHCRRAYRQTNGL